MQSRDDNEQSFALNDNVEVAITTALGGRSEQQDCYGFLLEEEESLTVICDGMGGHDKGKMASNIAVKAILDMYEDREGTLDPVTMLHELTMNANDEVCTIDSDNLAGTTMVIIYIKGSELYWNSVGDSRAYLFRGSRYTQLTQDHNLKTVLEQKLSQGAISQEEYDRDIVRGEALINYLGIEPLELIDYNVRPLVLEQDDEIIVMTDGLYKFLEEESIFEILKNFKNINDAIGALENLVERGSRRNRTDRDNMTVAIIKKL
jgi:protein phosphatase